MSTATPPNPDPAAPRASDPTIGRLVADAIDNVRAIVRNEIALAKAEITVDATKAAKAAAMLVVAAVMAVFGLVFLLHTIALGLHALGLALWLSYLIVTLVLFVIAGIAGLMGLKSLKKVKPAPERAIATTKQSVDAVKRSTSGAATERARLADPTTHGPSQATNYELTTSTPRSTAGTGSTEVTTR